MLIFHFYIKFCKTHGGFLAEPRTQEETNYIELFLLPDENYWIGKLEIQFYLTSTKQAVKKYL